MALHSVSFIVAALSGTAMAAVELKCPVLSCGADFEEMKEGRCFEHDGNVPTKKINGRLCYDT